MAFAQPAMVTEHLGTKSSHGSHTESKSKKRLSSHQLEKLEEGFQEGIKLDPERKTKLSRELGLEPCQVAVWFQNRCARWKTKKMELLYDEHMQEFDVTCKEKSKLPEEYVDGFPTDETVRSSYLLPFPGSTSEVGLHDRHSSDAAISVFGSDGYNAATHP